MNTSKQPLRWRIAQYFELLWWKKYLQKKDPEVYLTWKKQYWHDFLDKLRPNIAIEKQHSIMDMGCGPAGIFTILDNNKVTAVDPLLSSYATQLKHFNKERYKHVSFHESSMEDYATNEQYDIIFCINAINHVADIKKSVEKLYSLLKPNGKLVISIDAHNYNSLKYLFRLIPGDILHPHQYDVAEYEKMLIEQGFSNLKTQKFAANVIFDYYVIVAERNN